MKTYTVYTSPKIAERDRVYHRTTVGFNPGDGSSYATHFEIPIGATPQEIQQILRDFSVRLHHLENYQESQDEG